VPIGPAPLVVRFVDGIDRCEESQGDPHFGHCSLRMTASRPSALPVPYFWPLTFDSNSIPIQPGLSPRSEWWPEVPRSLSGAELRRLQQRHPRLLQLGEDLVLDSLALYERQTTPLEEARYALDFLAPSDALRLIRLASHPSGSVSTLTLLDAIAAGQKVRHALKLDS
jgi:hypothetical protein